MKKRWTTVIVLLTVLPSAWPAPQTNQHWSFQTPHRAAVPPIKDERGVRNPIDAFVRARLEQENLTPSAETDRPTLLRRLSFDLLGLPPTPEEVADFVADTRPDAYEQRVDRLLASPHFGEQWGRHWLDLARYAESDGYEKDQVRPYAWLYRDWVIDAINRDLTFDRFTIEQLAGDLLPEASLEQKTATGFHRQTLTNKEGGVDQEEFRCKATVDRVDTTAAVWLGLTLGCAECHSHKYDPITQREFYQVYAFFNNASEKDLPAPRPEELARYHAEKKQWDEENAQRKAALSAHLTGDFSHEQAKWEKNLPNTSPHWVVLEPKAAASSNGTVLKIQADGSLLAADQSPTTDTYTVETETELNGITGFRLEVINNPLPGKGPGRAQNGGFVLSEFRVHVRHDNEITAVPLTNATADFSQQDYGVALSVDGNPRTGWAISPQNDKRHFALLETAQDLHVPPDGKLVLTLDQQYGKQYTIERFRLAATTAPRPFRLDQTPDAIAAILAIPSAERSETQRTALATYYREEIDPGGIL